MKPMNLFSAGFCAAFALVAVADGLAWVVLVDMMLVGLNLYIGLRRAD